MWWTLEQIEIGIAEVVAVVASYFLLRSIWRSLPQWAKPEFVRRWEGEELEANDKDLNSPFVICGKLQEMFKIASIQCNEVTPDEMPFRRLLGCFLALVRLWAEIRENHPNFREEQYHDYEANRSDVGCIPGRSVDAEKDDVENLSMYLEYADWAYLEDYNDLMKRLQKQSYDLLRQDLATQPGRVGHYIALDYTRKVCMIGIKGTSHVSDIVTDLVAKSVPIELENSPFDDKDDDGSADSGSTVIRVHEGIWLAAQILANELQELIENVFLPGGYKFFITGHSLGAGTSCLLGLLLRSRIPELKEPDRLRVVAFATPAVLNFDACVACAPFCTSIVNNSDIVPRASISNLVIMNQLIVMVQSKVPGQYSKYPYKVGKNTKALYRNLRDLMKKDDQTIMSPEEWDAFMDETNRTTKVVENLYVPGKVLCLYERADMDDDDTTKEYGGVVADGGMKMLRQIEFTSNMVADHSCNLYRETIRGFTQQLLGVDDDDKKDEKKDDDKDEKNPLAKNPLAKKSD